MPRKRTTRAQKERSKPQLKDRDENKDGLSAKERAEKLQTYLKDLDIQGVLIFFQSKIGVKPGVYTTNCL